MDDNDLAHALSHHRAGRFADAETIYRRILERDMFHAVALNYYGVLAVQTGQLELAVKLLHRAVAANPTDPTCHCNLAEALRHSGQLSAAIASCRAAIRLDPKLAAAHNNLGIALAATGDHAGAIAAYRQAIALAPGYAQAHGNLANVLRDRGEIASAIDAARTATRLRPNDAECHNQLAVALAEAGEIDEAIEQYTLAIKLNPSHADAHSNLGNALAAQGRVREAVDACEAAVKLRPESIPAHWNFAVALLRAGDYERGWVEHEWRLRGVDGSTTPRFESPAWQGQKLGRKPDAKTILLHAEQGFGDAIQFARYAPLLAVGGDQKVIIECQRELVELFQSLAGVDAVVARGQNLPPFDEHISLMSLPLICRTRLGNIPSAVPYLRADPAAVARWRTRLDSLGRGQHVGLCWSGNPLHRHDRQRSIPPELLAPLARDGVILHSLQLVPPPARLPIVDHSPELTDFAQTAAMLANLDAIITVDTAVAHLCGAMGLPAFVLLHSTPDWRWMMHRTDCAWYPTMRIVRQHKAGDWSGVIGQLLKRWHG
jgi:Flp pilus assembly protein TadD